MKQTAILLILLFILAGCNRSQDRGQLTKIAELANSSPQEALDSLSTVNYHRLSDDDRHFYDFLSIKANDKCYNQPSSDSLILDVIDFYKSSRPNHIYPEALYYGGRVYSELGDYPTALQYFQQALDILPRQNPNLELKSCILSQTGRLLNGLRLYEQAIPYIQEAISLDSITNDSINEIYDYQLLGLTYLRADSFSCAEKIFSKALAISRKHGSSHSAKSSMYLAGAKFRLNQLDSALLYIRHTPDLVRPLARNSALAYASQIYLAAGILDSAYMYASELINSSDITNKHVGYQTILSPELRAYSDPDSINEFISDYSAVLEQHFNEKDSQLAIEQRALYNYQIHQREREAADRSKRTFQNGLILMALIALSLAILSLYFKNKTKNTIIQLHSALNNIRILKKHIRQLDTSVKKNGSASYSIPSIDEDKAHKPSRPRHDTQELREQLRSELLCLYNATPVWPIPSGIISSKVYQDIQSLIQTGGPIKDKDSSLWTELEHVVLNIAPQFNYHLRLLTNGKLTSYDYHTALLIKCGISPTQIAHLLNRSANAIVSRRNSLCFKIFDEDLGTKVIDGIIRLL